MSLQERLLALLDDPRTRKAAARVGQDWKESGDDRGLELALEAIEKRRSELLEIEAEKQQKLDEAHRRIKQLLEMRIPRELMSDLLEDVAEERFEQAYQKADAIEQSFLEIRRGQPGLQMVWRGVWDRDVEYQPGDAVRDEGMAFVCLVRTLDQPNLERLNVWMPLVDPRRLAAYVPVSGGGGGTAASSGGGVTDHGALTGLGDDDHPQYLTQAEADALYDPLGGGGGGGAPATADYLVGTAQAGLSAEIVVGTTPGGELSGTWASPTVDASHSGSTHAATQAAAEATAAAALTNHEGAGNPHPTYLTQAEGDAAYAPIGLAALDFLVGTATGALSGEIVVGTSPGGELGGTWASPTVDATHSGSSHAGVVSTHEGASDPHTGYQKESEKGAASGYASLDSGTKVPTAELGGAGADNTKFLRGDQTWAVPSGGGAPTDVDYLVGTASGGLSAEIVVGTSPGGELGGTWASPTVDATHSGSSHAGVVSTHEAAADPHTGYVLESLVDAKGDILTASADNTPARLAVGTNFSHTLTPDSGQTTGLLWTPRLVYKSADEVVNNSTVLQNDDHLKWAIGTGNEVWFFQLWLHVLSVNTTMDMQLMWTFPTGTTMLWGAIGGNSAPWDRVATGSTPTTMLTQVANPTVGSSAGNPFGLHWAGTVFGATTAGDIQLQWAQNTADANDLTVKKGSCLLLWRMA